VNREQFLFGLILALGRSDRMDAAAFALAGHSRRNGSGTGVALPSQGPRTARYLAACVAMALMIALPAAAVIPLVAPASHAIDGRPTRSEVLADHDVYRIFVARSWQTWIVPNFPTIVGVWMAGAGIFSVRLLGGFVLARRWMRRDSRPIVWPSIDRLKERMGVGQAVTLLESAGVEVPMVVGWLRPAILVPVATLSGLAAPELDAILAHELAHIRRHDYLVNVLQCIVETLVFYHPATWWITRVIRREREHCCDDMAVAVIRDRVTYARALAAMEGLRAPVFSLSPSANSGNLLVRVRRILKPQEESMKPVSMLVGLVVVLAIAPIWLVRADDQATKADPGTARPRFRRNAGAAGVRAEFKAWKDLLPIAEIEAAPTGRIMIDAGTPECLKHQALDKINDAEAEKTFTTAMYYKRIGKVAAAKFYFGKIAQRWPNSPWAAKAKAQQAQADSKPSDRTAVDIFNFTAGGIY
jgi:beta-lactamase regulating signal transducer with metallopeptidase domain